ncbi:hypothetical protein ACVDG3_18160 [Meridianimarinicoccus sp. RP-17]|uniref:hypothetical protein n=1 Tax=Meridianimarinicoccus zhengii TaxID=2056810 RepID=UPI0013A6967A|nr:hypothetical protein [Phycocomes zhengii]
MSSHLTPFEVTIRLFGSSEEVSSIAGLHRKSGYAWHAASKWRDAGDLPSTRVMRALLAEARARGIPLEHRHLIEGAPAAEIDALLGADRPAVAA